jgi:hypothetical protein
MKIKDVFFDRENLFFKLEDGTIVGNPISWYVRLERATPEQRTNFEISPFGVHWEELDEDISLEGMIRSVAYAKAS